MDENQKILKNLEEVKEILNRIEHKNNSHEEVVEKFTTNSERDEAIYRAAQKMVSQSDIAKLTGLGTARIKAIIDQQKVKGVFPFKDLRFDMVKKEGQSVEVFFNGVDKDEQNFMGQILENEVIFKNRISEDLQERLRVYLESLKITTYEEVPGGAIKYLLVDYYSDSTAIWIYQPNYHKKIKRGRRVTSDNKYYFNFYNLEISEGSIGVENLIKHD